MLTALGGQEDALGDQDLLDGLEDGLADLGAGMAAHLIAGDLAGGAAHHQDLALAELADLTQLLDSQFGFLTNLI